MVVNDRPWKRIKRKINSDVYDFLTFPTEPVGAEPFRTSVRSFVSKYAREPFPPFLFLNVLTWQILFRKGDYVLGDDCSATSSEVIPLDIVEEDVTRSKSVYCDHCRVVGWSGHPVCRKRYHFIIRTNSNLTEGYQKSCSICGNLMNLLDSRCKSCNIVISGNEVEEWAHLQLEDSTHLLHGVVHSNGYAHLLTVNGREGGSNYLSGCDIVNFWDRLCTTLSIRKVSVMDVSKKYGMEYRLLHGITRGHPWYGDWGYEFGSGSYGATLDSYKKAINTLSNIPLSLFFYQGREPWSRLQTVIAFYQSISDSGLDTLKDLFSFLVSLIHRESTSATARTILCAWKRKDLEAIEETMIKLLVASMATGGDSGRWVTRRAIKRAMCSNRASPVLIDYCLKHLGGRRTSDGTMIVQSRRNHISQAFEFRLEPVDSSCVLLNIEEVNYPSREQIMSDLKLLYESILDPQTMVKFKPEATRKIIADSASKLLDCKKFVKDFKLEKKELNPNPNSCALRIWCHIQLTNDDPKEHHLPPPPELVILSENARIRDLKNEATKAFSDVYILFKKFHAEEVDDYIDDSMSLKLLYGTSGSVRIKGRCQQGKDNVLNQFRMERGMEKWTVDCMCGAKDDDGEKMLACDKCGVWQHTRCTGIDTAAAAVTNDDENGDVIPAKFLCLKCAVVDKQHKNHHHRKIPRPRNRNKTCREEQRPQQFHAQRQEKGCC